MPQLLKEVLKKEATQFGFSDLRFISARPLLEDEKLFHESIKFQIYKTLVFIDIDTTHKNKYKLHVLLKDYIIPYSNQNLNLMLYK